MPRVRKPTKKIQEQIDRLSSWLPNFDHGPEDFPTLGEMLEAIEDKQDVEDLIDGLLQDEDEDGDDE